MGVVNFEDLLGNYMRLDLERKNREMAETFREQRLIRDEQRRIAAQRTPLEDDSYGSIHIPALDPAGRVPSDLLSRLIDEAVDTSFRPTEIANASAKLKKCIHYLKKTYETARLYNAISEEEKLKIEKLIGSV
jgi:hypothetical protein